MIPASFGKQARFGAFAFALCALAPLGPKPAVAAIETDPTALYATMKKAYDAGLAHRWPFADERYYLSTIFDAGRAYSLFRSSDPNYAEVARLAVDVATQLHYDPLVSDDAASWYVREAADYVIAHGDQARVVAATNLLDKVDATDTDRRLAANNAVSDALANVQAFPSDGDALAEQIVADVRAYNLTGDAAYRSALLQHAANAATPLGRVPDTELSEMFAIVEKAQGADSSFSDEDRTNAKIIDDRRKHNPDLQFIGRVRAVSHDLRMTRTAPADEYFGNLKMSPIGVRNEYTRITKYLDVGWGARMSSDALNLANAVIDWQRQYPHDATLPKQLLDIYKLLERVDSEPSRKEAAKFRDLLLVEYASTPQARELASS